MGSYAAFSPLSVWIRLQNFQKATYINSSEKRKGRIKVIVILWIMVKQLQTGPNTVKHSYLFTATTYSTEHEIRPNRYFTVCMCSFLSIFPSPSLLQSSQVLFLSKAQLCQSVWSNIWISSIQLYLTRCLSLEHLQIIPIGYGLPQERQTSCISWLSESNTLKRQKIQQKTFHLQKFLSFCHWIRKINKQA